MTVMSDIYIDQPTSFSTEEIGAARSVFLQYSEEKQIQLLAVMPKEEAIAILAHCSVAYVQHLLDQLEKHGYEKRTSEYARELGFISSQATMRGVLKQKLVRLFGAVFK
ncbi:hypothetical protein L3Q72_03170 [Vibrio sp. JC009]|uniref:hypothetical protein n=1 Tax=Vibrio sp. JC009 TaxID=2912314 RepID=UPI0023AF5373|nr:hypothetical protein [Vibrio sp. JC009]WED22420.1 hypothetical protein L3Q72_03170 [Vibrio sp. JC009]